MRRVLLVCLGTLCRAPIATAVMQNVITKAGAIKNWEVDSAGIGDWHEGSAADPRAMAVLQKHGLTYTKLGRKITQSDFNSFNYILGMDEENMHDLRLLAPSGPFTAKLFMLGDFGLDKDDRTIEDPYFQKGEKGFEKVYQQCVIACQAFYVEAAANKI